MYFKIATFAFVFLLSGCGGGGGSPAPAQPPVAQLPPSMTLFSFKASENEGLEIDLTMSELNGTFSGRTLTNVSSKDLILALNIMDPQPALVILRRLVALRPMILLIL